ncbi:hypothetical protein [Chitinophaga rhizophila]|uniref:Uncharacterized protein n=1 Tax=Chitinophaga rhizophila TaxID=2866212 RepID=A0ABS7GB04_9BACT|nr:hypothetical protein [Chitinophaga rhizophila]MBW8684851.1 hypothetical protein [Chitinophaga rhizophila]
MSKIYYIAVNAYRNLENAVIGNILYITTDSKDRCNTRLLFDYLFFHLVLLIPKYLIGLYARNTTELLLNTSFLFTLVGCLLLLRKGTPVKTVSVLAAFLTLILPAACSFLNNQDLSPRYSMVWIVSILFCYIATNATATLALGATLCGYLTLVAWVQVNQIPVYSTPGFTHEQSLIFNPIITGLYILFLIRVLGAHYKNIFITEHERTLQKQRQHSSLLSQRLTKQFIILKGLSRSGKSKYMDGNKELLEACLVEIEKQCESAISYLDDDSASEN